MAIEYTSVLADWRTACASLTPHWIPDATTQKSAEIDEFIKSKTQFQRSAEPSPGLRGIPLSATELLRSVVACHKDMAGHSSALDQLANEFSRLHNIYQGLRGAPTSSSLRDSWSERMLGTLAFAGIAVARAPAQDISVLFLSESPNSIGHIYRVQHAAAALSLHGWSSRIMDLQDPNALVAVDQASMVLVFRARWGHRFAAVRDRCTRNRIPLAYDIDDLIFDPEIIASGKIAYLDGSSMRIREKWLNDAVAFRRALEAADAGIFTTAPLARAASRHCTTNFVLPNTLGPGTRLDATESPPKPKPSHVDGRQRILFASGTRSHHRDFGEIADVVSRVLDRDHQPILIILGDLNPRIYPELKRHRKRIISIPKVPFNQLTQQVSIADINLCPLESGNPFCECKSSVRWLTAAVAGVPSIVSATEPLKDAVVHQITGLVAVDCTAWERAFEDMLSAPKEVRAMGFAARSDADARFGFDGWALRTLDVYWSILNRS